MPIQVAALGSVDSEDAHLSGMSGRKIDAATTISLYASATGEPVVLQKIWDARAKFAAASEIATMERLGTALAPYIGRALGADEEVTRGCIEALSCVIGVARRLVDKDVETALTEDDFDALTGFSDALRPYIDDLPTLRLLEETLARARELVGVSAVDFAQRLTPDLDPSEIVSSQLEFDVTYPILVPPSAREPLSRFPGSVHFGPGDVILEISEARAAIDAKARALGELAGQASGRVEFVPGTKDGYRRNYPGCTVYWSRATGAHEVHGDIRAKYDAVDGPRLLGLPTTDESGTPDGRGRYNHFFNHASIYWTATTGPFWIAGAVRSCWKSTGWERGDLGYPIVDQYVMRGAYPTDDVDIEWITFENGAIGADHGEARVATFASVASRPLADAFYRMIDGSLSSRQISIASLSATIRPGLYGVDVLGVDPVEYGFWASTTRTLRLKVRGFVSVPVAHDPHWEADINVRFRTRIDYPDFLFPQSWSLVVDLISARYSVDGVASGEIASNLKDGFERAFGHDTQLGRAITDVPTGANQRGRGNLDVLGLHLLGDGSLAVFFNPVPEVVGKIRKIVGQNMIDSKIESI